MFYNDQKAKEDLELLKDLALKLKKILDENPFLKDIGTMAVYEKKLEKIDKELSLLKKQIEELYLQKNDLSDLKEKLDEIKKIYDTLCKKRSILDEVLKLETKINNLQEEIIKNAMESTEKRNNIDIHRWLFEVKNEDELKDSIDAACIAIYKIPLLVALITKDPSEIINDFQISELPEERKNQVINYIVKRKREIDNNLILSNKALIDLIENTTGKNITSQQRRNEIVTSSYNNQFNGQILSETNNGYFLLSNQKNKNRLTSGDAIKRFNDMYGTTQFKRKDSDMLVRDFPAASEDIIYKKFKDLPDDRKRYLISIVISNLKLCYEMFKSYYLNGKVQTPISLNLTNGKTINHIFKEQNLPHILGIPPTNKWVQIDKNHGSYIGDLELPIETINYLGISNASSLVVLERILEKENDIINKCGLNYDPLTKTYYEMLPWEKIILKTNAFIRGDFFKTTSLISPVNTNSFLISPNDNIERISITPTRFSQSAINQLQINPNIPFKTTKNALFYNNPISDFTFKGMEFDEKRGIWITKTNVSAIGERIKPSNDKTLKTLEKYRYLISGINDPSNGGFVASVKSLNDNKLLSKFSTKEILITLAEIANSFGTTTEIQNNLREYLDQIVQLNMSNTPDEELTNKR